MLLPTLTSFATSYALTGPTSTTDTSARIVHTIGPVRFESLDSVATLNTAATGSSSQINHILLKPAEAYKLRQSGDQLILPKRSIHILGPTPALFPFPRNIATMSVDTVRDFGLRPPGPSQPAKRASSYENAANSSAKSNSPTTNPPHPSSTKSFSHSTSNRPSPSPHHNPTGPPPPHKSTTSTPPSTPSNTPNEKSGVVNLESWAVLTVADVGAPIQEEWRAAELVSVRRWTLLMLPRGYLGRFCIDVLIARAFLGGYMPGLLRRPGRTKGRDYYVGGDGEGKGGGGRQGEGAGGGEDYVGSDGEKGGGGGLWRRTRRFWMGGWERGKRDRKGRLVMGLVGLEMVLLMGVKFGVQFLLCNPMILVWWRKGEPHYYY